MAAVKIESGKLLEMLKAGIKPARIAEQAGCTATAIYQRIKTFRRKSHFIVSRTLCDTRSFKIPRSLKDSLIYRDITLHQRALLGLLVRVGQLDVSEIAAMHWSIPYSLFECGALEWKDKRTVIATPRGQYLSNCSLPLEIVWQDA